jgi:peptidyl-prolyl cis-trans isomerase-like protein 2
VSSFHHVKFGTKVDKSADSGIRADPSMRKVLGKMGEERQKADKEEQESKKRQREEMEAMGVAPAEEEVSTALPATSANFTMMGFVPKKETVVLIPAKKTTRKGSVRLYTTHGQLDVLLHCDLVPVACENFLRHCASGYYKGIKFHRLIKSFMIQGGDPTGTGRGGESCWGRPFQDEISDKLKHNKRGVLSMANSGPNTNKSQFFVLFSSRPHLDKRHTVFGEVTGGLETLDAMEAVPTSGGTGKDVPLLDIVLLDTAVLFDPFLHLDDEKKESEQVAKTAESNAERGEWFSNIAKGYQKPKVREGVGKYLAPEEPARSGGGGIDFGAAVAKKARKPTGDFGSAF